MLGSILISVLLLQPFNNHCAFSTAQAFASTHASADTAAQRDQDTPLQPGRPLERVLAGGELHIYRITLTAGESIQLVAEQKDIDVVLALSRPDGQEIVAVADSYGTQEPKRLWWVADTGGIYTLRVHAREKQASKGSYRLRIEEQRTATLEDRNRVAAQTAFVQGQKLLEQGTAESKQSAIVKFEESLSYWRATRDTKPEAHLLLTIGMVYTTLSEPRKALGYYEQALQLYRASGDRFGEAEILNEFGHLYGLLGEPRKELEYLKAIPSIFHAVGDRRSEAIVLSNIGAAYDALGDEQLALDYLSQSLPIARAAEDRVQESNILNNIGMVYRSLAETQSALEYLNQALSSSVAAGDQAITLNNLGLVYHDAGEDQKALHYYSQALPILRVGGDRRAEASVLLNISASYDSLDELEKALNYNNQSLSILRAVADQRTEARALLRIAGLHRKAGKEQIALEEYTSALVLMRAAGDRQREAYALQLIGNVYKSRRNLSKALEFYHQSLPLSRSVEDRRTEAGTLLEVAEVERDQGNLVEAQRQAEAALAIVEMVRTKIGSQDLRTSYFALVLPYYEFYVDLLMRLHQLHPTEGYDAKALQVSEKARARSLIDMLNESGVNIREGIDPALLERERSLQQSLSTKADRLIRLLGGKHTEEQVATMKEEFEELLIKHQQVEADIRLSSPRYAALTQPQPLGLTEIQAELDPNTLLLEYTLGNEHSYLWAITSSSMSSFILPPRRSIEAAARNVYSLLTARNRQIKFETGEERRQRVMKADREYSRAAAVLSDMVLAPVTIKLADKKLLVITDGALDYVPFAVLPVNGIEASDRADPVGASRTSDKRFLILEHEIVSLPSATTLSVLRRELGGRKAASKTVAVLADPVFDKYDERLRVGAATAKMDRRAPGGGSAVTMSGHQATDVIRSAMDVGLGSNEMRIQRLPFTRKEADAIVSLVPKGESKEAVDFDANRATATSEELAQYRFVHFATHGFLNNVHPELSGIVLSLVDRQGADQNGFLRANEIFNLKLRAEMVILSGCSTGLGKEVRGEGFVGLTRGFMYAGAKRVVVSLWGVSDQASAELMSRMYKGMLGRDKLRPATALRAAQLTILQEKRWQAPYYWGAFVLEGEPR